MSKLHIQVASWNNAEQDYVPVGTVIYDNDPLHRLGFTGFVYDRDYIANGGPALDPVNLKTSENDGRFVFSMDGKLPSYFEQFLPGAFVEQLIAKQDPRWNSLNPAEKLFLLTEINGDFGAIQLNAHLDQFDNPIDRLDDLKALVGVIKDFQAGRSTPTLDNSQLRNLATFSGHTPKLDFEVAQEGSPRRYVVKLNSTATSNDALVSEVMSALQRKAGIDCVSSSRTELPGGDDVLLSQNYTRGVGSDVIGADSAGKTYSYNRVSLATLLSNSSTLGNTDIPTYRHAAEVIREVSASPKEDVEELFRRGVFSALTSHTSNGLDNIEMYDTGGGNWRLAPAFNNLPSLSPVAAFEMSFSGLKDTVNYLRTDTTMVSWLGQSMGLTEGEALKAALPVASALTEIGSTLAAHHVPVREHARIASAIDADAALKLRVEIAKTPSYQAEAQKVLPSGVDEAAPFTKSTPTGPGM